MPLYKEQELSHSSSTVFHDINSFPREQQHKQQTEQSSSHCWEQSPGTNRSLSCHADLMQRPNKPQQTTAQGQLSAPSHPQLCTISGAKLSENTVMYNTTTSGGGGSKRTERKRDYIYSCLSLDVPAAINEEHLFWEELPSVQLLASEHYPNSCWKETHFHSLFSEVFQGNNKISTVAQQSSSSQAAGRNVKP